MTDHHEIEAKLRVAMIVLMALYVLSIVVLEVLG